MPDFKSDQVLWYNVGVWGELGYAVPNFGDDGRTQNQTIQYLTSVMGRNLSALMHHPDADLRVPPSINTLTRIHKLILRARTILAGRAVAPGTPDFEAVHVQPGMIEHLIYPVPYFRVRSPHLKEYCGLILNALAEAMQHTENRKPYEISLNFAGLVGSYLQRVYRRMATELFAVASNDAAKPDFILTDAVLASYNPAAFFTSTEMIDRVPPIERVPTEDDLSVLTDGIPSSRIVGLARYPSGSPADIPGAPSDVVAAASSVPAFAPPPGREGKDEGRRISKPEIRSLPIAIGNPQFPKPPVPSPESQRCHFLNGVCLLGSPRRWCWRWGRGCSWCTPSWR